MKSTEYKAQMDALHVPEEKANETLRLMLEENRRLRQQEAKKGTGRKKAVLIPGFALAAAACVLLAFFILRQPGRTDLFYGLQLSSLPSAGVSRGDEGTAFSFQDVFGLTPETLFPGWTVAEESSSAMLMNEQQVHESRLTLRQGDAVLTASVTDFEPPVLTWLKKENVPADSGIYWVKDTGSQTLLAVYEKEGIYPVLSSGGASEEEFRSMIGELR